MKILITGFEPFGGQRINPSREAAQLLPDRLGPHRLYKLQIPVAFGLAADAVIAEAENIHPDRILCVGQAGGRAALTPERIAINLRDASIPDNFGYQPCEEPVIAGGPAAFFSTLPVNTIAEAIRAAGVSSEVSLSAGSFVCNDLFYRLLARYDGSPVKVGFLHVPFLPEQALRGEPSMPLEEIARGLLAGVTCLSEDV